VQLPGVRLETPSFSGESAAGVSVRAGYCISHVLKFVGAATLRVSVLVFVPIKFPTVIEIGKLPATVGVPLKIPVNESNESPVGSAPVSM
jgi:hypothetical protein